ncbi:Sensor histidine kinase LiaS [Corynebacterium kalinowskii]|uniref:Sensor histidine kinase LiaS n=1 Tax=Corynebacterium kalinowskii TaxID=2675216 RepID=A0A6B8VV54_9CORY|nr:ATP-binding protein [Corynebacterium kalinowskii]QGU02805.1 Sensor histidine kinase LiaS [Corynebacterium kalinowskii]
MMYPKFYRPRKRVVGGVASGLAVHLKMDVLTIRLVLLVSCLFGGLGLVFYMGTWMMTKPATAEQEASCVIPEGTETPKGLNLIFVIGGIAAAVLSFSAFTGFQGSTLVPAVIVGVGALVAWQAYDQGVEALLRPRNTLTIMVGVILVFAGIFFVSINWADPAVFGATFTAVLFTLVGAAVLAVPLLLQMWRRLTEERDEKAKAEERAEIASRIHDSVLQTLALIQKRSEEPMEVARLARGQERELRQWLFDGKTASSTTVSQALELAAGEVEDLYGIRIAPVTVGDTPMTDETQAAVFAAREAMVNAAKHAHVSSVDVYSEVFGDLEIFVRDRGVGFNMSDIDPDRHGVKDSILGRVERVGGVATVKSTPGEGTEVHIKLPVDSKA